MSTPASEHCAHICPRCGGCLWCDCCRCPDDQRLTEDVPACVDLADLLTEDLPQAVRRVR